MVQWFDCVRAHRQGVAHESHWVNTNWLSREGNIEAKRRWNDYRGHCLGNGGRTTYLPLLENLADERSEANAETPIVFGHGTLHPVVALQRGTESRDRLQALGYHVSWHTYPMIHAVCSDEIADLKLWLGQLLL